MPKKIFVLNTAIISKAFEILFEKICVLTPNIEQNSRIASTENKLKLLEIMKNQKVNPAVTANALNLGEEICISNRIDECN